MMRPNTVKTLAAASAAVNQNGAAIIVENVPYCSLQAVVTGTSTGTLIFQTSNDLPAECSYSSGAPAPVNWAPIAGATVSIAGAGLYQIPLQQICANFLRVNFAAGNGQAGTITVRVCTQGF